MIVSTSVARLVQQGTKMFTTKLCTIKN